MSDDYRVGRGKPPLHSRFQKGQSGNPRGRPTRSGSVVDLVASDARRRHRVNVGGRVQHLSQAQIASRQLWKKAMEGDLRAIRLVEKFQARNAADGMSPKGPIEYEVTLVLEEPNE